jgi:protein O-mannosyl-transferase
METFLKSKAMHWIIPMVAFLLYANTLTHEYVLDDGIVIRENKFTKQGFSGIWDILTTDSFYGFLQQDGKENLVSGGRYRPLSVVSFAVEYGIFGSNPFIGHLMTILYYSLLCWLIFVVLSLLFREIDQGLVLAVIGTLIYTLHPVHTEVVANIKGRDEIFAMGFSMAALYYLILYHDKKKNRDLGLSLLFLFLGLMSKENSITFCAIIPLSLYLFRSVNFGSASKYFLLLLIPAILFIVFRQSVLGSSIGVEPMELMNNPFIKWDGAKYVNMSFSERYGTILFTWASYLKLLFWPMTLTNDYYPKHIEMMSFDNLKVILSIALNAILLFAAFYLLNKHRVVSFGILFYFICFSIVSNLIFPIGTNMAERFMFMPSLGFAITIAYFLLWLMKKSSITSWIISAGFSLFFIGKTFSRNLVWKDNYTLFTNDVKASPNSAKALCAAAGVLLEEMDKKSDTQKEKDIALAIEYLDKAMTIHPIYENALLLLGNAYFYKKDFETAISSYRKVLVTYPGQTNAINNLALTLRDYGKYAGESMGQINKAKVLLQESFDLSKDDIETVRLLAVANGATGDHAKAIELFKIVIQKEPKNANAYINLATAYEFLGDKTTAQQYRNAALQLDPKILNK